MADYIEKEIKIEVKNPKELLSLLVQKRLVSLLIPSQSLHSCFCARIHPRWKLID